MKKSKYVIIIFTFIALAVGFLLIGVTKADAEPCGKACAVNFASFGVISDCEDVYVKDGRGIDFIKHKTPTDKKHVIIAHSRKDYLFRNGSRWMRVVKFEKSCS